MNHIAAKASGTLGFLRRKLYNCTKEARERSYNTFAVPTLQYASAAWDPYLEGDMEKLSEYSEEEPGSSTKTTETERQVVSPKWSTTLDGFHYQTDYVHTD